VAIFSGLSELLYPDTILSYAKDGNERLAPKQGASNQV
jgi:hypothetical protein